MNKKTLASILTGIAFLIIGALTFIHYSNDHLECENVIEYSTGENGEKITTEKHICKERFNF